jgi:SAM-dependent methyltransferase
MGGDGGRGQQRADVVSAESAGGEPTMRQHPLSHDSRLTTHDSRPARDTTPAGDEGRAGREGRRVQFDAAAAGYAAARPGYPEALFDDLVALAGLPAGGAILEIGPGTGQATVPLARRGYRITAVELGASLAEETRRATRGFPGVTVVVGDFETLALPPASYDLVTAATAFHWLDPATRYARAARLLRPGGALAPFRSEHVRSARDGNFAWVSQAVYARLLPEWAAAFPGIPWPDEVADAEAGRIVASGLFAPPVTRRYLWETTYDAAGYLALLDTYSDYRRLAPDVRARLFDGLATLIDRDFGGRITKGYLTTLTVVRRR